MVEYLVLIRHKRIPVYNLILRRDFDQLKFLIINLQNNYFGNIPFIFEENPGTNQKFIYSTVDR